MHGGSRPLAPGTPGARPMAKTAILSGTRTASFNVRYTSAEPGLLRLISLGLPGVSGQEQGCEDGAHGRDAAGDESADGETAQERVTAPLAALNRRLRKIRTSSIGWAARRSRTMNAASSAAERAKPARLRGAPHP